MFTLLSESDDHILFLKDLPFELKKYSFGLKKNLDKDHFVTVQLEHCVNFSQDEIQFEAQLRVNMSKSVNGNHSLEKSETIKLVDGENYTATFLNELAEELNQEMSNNIDFAIMGGEVPTGTEISEQTRDLFGTMLAGVGIRYNYNCSPVVVAGAIQSITIVVTE